MNGYRDNHCVICWFFFKFSCISVVIVRHVYLTLSNPRMLESLECRISIESQQLFHKVLCVR